MKNIFFYLILVSLITSCNDQENAQGQLTSLRNKTQQKIDSIEREKDYKAKLYLFTDSVINNSPIYIAEKSIDSLILHFPNDYQFRLFKGDLYMHNGNIQNAIEEYSIAVTNGYIPIALEKRATAYIKTKNFTDALKDLKLAAAHNSDYYYSIGYTFELMKKYDSALSYFKLYLSFSDNKNVKIHTDSLEQKLKQ